MDSLSLYNCCLLVVLVALSYLAKCYIASTQSYHSSNLRLPPGPWQLPVIGSLHHLLGALPHHTLHRLSRRYGPLMYLKLGEVPTVVVSSREAAKEVMKTHDLVFATRFQTETLKILLKHGQAVALAPYGDHWRQLRKICVMELLSSSRVQSFSPVREEAAARLMGTIASTSSAAHNLSELITAYTADTTVHAIMGRRIQDRDTFIRYMDEAIELTSGFSLADLFPSSRLARALCRKGHKAEAYREDLFKFLDVIVSEHIERQSREKEAFEQDLIDVLLGIQRQGSASQPLTMGTIKAVVFVSSFNYKPCILLKKTTTYA
jgi:cytochrome P450